MRLTAAFYLGALVVFAGCAQQEEPTPVVAEPVYDKYGNVVHTMPGAVPGTVMVDTDGDGVVDTPVPAPDPIPDQTPPYRNQNEIQNEIQNQTRSGT